MAESIREIVFDTETTGLSPREGDRVIEIGAIELLNRFPTGKFFHVFINPEGREVHPDALNIHGISNEFLKDKPSFKDILADFEEFFADGNLVAHNASFDMDFLNAEMQRVGSKLFDPVRVVDTLLIARRKFPGQRNSLDALCSRFDIDNSHREKHGALLDSELLAEVYLELMGGRQASLTLEHASASVDENTVSALNAETRNAQQRPKALPPRLSREDIEKHRRFIEEMGGNPVWKQTGLL